MALLNTSADKHGIFPGYRDADSAKSKDIDEAVYSWIEGSGDAADAPCACRYRGGYSFSNVDDRHGGCCLVASVG